MFACGVELMRLWANNVCLTLDPIKLAFREPDGSCRQAVAAALHRLKAKGVVTVSIRMITEEVHAVGLSWSLETISAAVRREARGVRVWAEPLPLERVGAAKYRIL